MLPGYINLVVQRLSRVWPSRKSGYGVLPAPGSQAAYVAGRGNEHPVCDSGHRWYVASTWSIRSASALLCSDEGGSSLVELAVAASLYALLLVGSVDLGQACYVAIELAAAADAGAQYGTRNPTNTAGMQQAAVLNAANLSAINTNAAWGCECSDGSSPSPSCTVAPSCSSGTVKYVTVTTSMIYKPALSFPGVPASFAVQESARLRSSY